MKSLKCKGFKAEVLFLPETCGLVIRAGDVIDTTGVIWVKEKQLLQGFNLLGMWYKGGHTNDAWSEGGKACGV